MDSVGEAEGVGLVVLLLVSSMRHTVRHYHWSGVDSMDHGSGDNMAAETSMTNETNASDAIRQRNT